jgi:hypothetical protein
MPTALLRNMGSKVTHVAPRVAHRLEFDTDLSQLLHYHVLPEYGKKPSFFTVNIYRTGKAVEGCTKVLRIEMEA